MVQGERGLVKAYYPSMECMVHGCDMLNKRGCARPICAK